MQHVKNANRRKCNENVENASECIKMHKNAYGKNQHHFREKTTTIPTQPGIATLPRRTPSSSMPPVIASPAASAEHERQISRTYALVNRRATASSTIPSMSTCAVHFRPASTQASSMSSVSPTAPHVRFTSTSSSTRLAKKSVLPLKLTSRTTER